MSYNSKKLQIPPASSKIMQVAKSMEKFAQKCEEYIDKNFPDNSMYAQIEIVPGEDMLTDWSGDQLALFGEINRPIENEWKKVGGVYLMLEELSGIIILNTGKMYYVPSQGDSDITFKLSEVIPATIKEFIIGTYTDNLDDDDIHSIKLAMK